MRGGSYWVFSNRSERRPRDDSLSLSALGCLFSPSSPLCHFLKKAEFGRGGILVLRMIEPLLTSCQQGPFSPARLVGSGLGNSHTRAFVFQFVWRRQTLTRKGEPGRK